MAEQIFYKMVQHCLEVFLLHVYFDLHCTALTVKGEKMIMMTDKDDLNWTAYLLSSANAYVFQFFHLKITFFHFKKYLAISKDFSNADEM